MTFFTLDVKVLTCPITHGLFREPVILPDGHTYEMSAIEELLNKTNDSDEETQGARNRLVRRHRFFYNAKCPMNPSIGLRSMDDVIINYTMKSMVAEFTRQHPRHPLVIESKKEQKEVDLQKGREIMGEVLESTQKAAKLGDPMAKLMLEHYNKKKCEKLK